MTLLLGKNERLALQLAVDIDYTFLVSSIDGYSKVHREITLIDGVWLGPLKPQSSLPAMHLLQHDLTS